MDDLIVALERIQGVASGCQLVTESLAASPALASSSRPGRPCFIYRRPLLGRDSAVEAPGSQLGAQLAGLLECVACRPVGSCLSLPSVIACPHKLQLGRGPAISCYSCDLGHGLFCRCPEAKLVQGTRKFECCEVLSICIFVTCLLLAGRIGRKFHVNAHSATEPSDFV